jgi:F-type H+-transporting ATPase subunit epsilon
MKLRVLTPTEVILEQDVVHVTAEDPTGSLGIQPGHAALVTHLVPGIVHVRGSGGQEQYVAVNGGLMMVGSDMIEIVSRQAIVGNDLQHLETHVVSDFEKELREDQAGRAAFEKLRVSFMRGVIDYDKANVQ